MKTFVPSISILCLALSVSGCSEKPEYTSAKQLMKEFSCPGGLTKDTNGRWAALMKSDIEKAQLFLTNYEQGKHLFSISIDEVIANQLHQYKVACKASKEGQLGL